MHYLNISFSHKNSTLDIREKLTYPDDYHLNACLTKLNTSKAINESILLSTCNRMEIFCSCNDISLATKHIFEMLNQRVGISLEELEGRADIFDAQYALPDKFKGKFDVFITDPVETLPGFTLFVSRATSSLKGKGCSGYLGLTTIEASREKWFEIQKRFLNMGFVITDIRRRFSVYPIGDISFSRYQEKCQVFKQVGVRADCDWYTSSFIRLYAVEEPKPIIEGTQIIDAKVYKDDESLATPY
jgi:predicted methyltransferase